MALIWLVSYGPGKAVYVQDSSRYKELSFDRESSDEGFLVSSLFRDLLLVHNVSRFTSLTHQNNNSQQE